ncbi:MAG: glycosyltransferase family 2 protein [Thermoplasmata archaeon]
MDNNIKNNLKIPYISVIITAHDRKEYILQAVESVLNQNIDRSFYEIIVVKNFIDEKIDYVLNKNNIINIYTNATEHGKKIKIGIDNSKGDVISFLDDDDLFKNDKINNLIKEFSNDEKLVYYHNYQEFISDINEKKKVKPYFKNYSGKFTIKELKNNLNNFIKKYNYGPLFFNCSSIAIRKKFYENVLKYFENISIHTDDMLFFLLLDKVDENLKIFIDNKVFTLYRYHSSTTNYQKNQKLKNNLKLKNILEMYINDTNNLLNIIKDENLKQFLKCRLNNEQFRLYLINKDKKFKKENNLIKNKIKCINYSNGNSIIRFFRAIRDLLKLIF